MNSPKPTLVDQLMAHRYFGFRDRNLLEIALEEAGHTYDGHFYSTADQERYPNTMHELAAPLTRVIELLDREGNRAMLLRAIGGAARLDALERRLDALRRAIPPKPPKVKGRPSKSGDLAALVHTLAVAWEEGTGKRFTLDWHKGKPPQPISHAACFVHDVVTEIAPTRLGSLPKVAAKVAAERRR